jgi:ABC-type dipeptide/oligopeptide/nickel transport system ATPase component
MERLRGREIGMIFQEPMTSLNPVLKVGTQLGEIFAKRHGLSGRAVRQAAIRALERVRIPDAARRLDQAPHQMSGGMLQRIMIAMALAGEPRLLIADEPTTALDVTIQAQILALLAEMKRETEMGLIFITHDIGLVAGIADRVAVMQGGRVVETGAADDVFDRPQHDYTRHLLNAVPHFRGGQSARRDAVRDGRAPALAVENLGVRFPVGGGFLRRAKGNVHAVDGVSFDLVPGETLGIVGESGSGKSTTARAILDLVRPTSGRVEGAGGHAVQMVFQNPNASLNPRMTVRTLLSEPVIAAGRRVDAEAEARMRMLLGKVDLPQGRARALPARVLGRPEAAHLHRPRADAGPEGARPRRSSVGPRRVGAGAGARPPGGPPARHGARLPLRLARHGRGRAHRPPDRRDLRGPHRRDRRGACGSLRSAPSLHAQAHRRRPVDREAPRRLRARDRRGALHPPPRRVAGAAAGLEGALRPRLADQGAVHDAAHPRAGRGGGDRPRRAAHHAPARPAPVPRRCVGAAGDLPPVPRPPDALPGGRADLHLRPRPATSCAPSSCNGNGGPARPVYSDINFILLGIALERHHRLPHPQMDPAPASPSPPTVRGGGDRGSAPGATASCAARCTTTIAARFRARAMPGCSAPPPRSSTMRRGCSTAAAPAPGSSR